jgi:hypothetical protein
VSEKQFVKNSQGNEMLAFVQEAGFALFAAGRFFLGREP